MTSTYNKILTIVAATGIILSSSATAAFAWIYPPSANPRCNNNKVVIDYSFQNNTTQTNENVTVTATGTSYSKTFNNVPGQGTGNGTISTNQSSYSGTVTFSVVWGNNQTEAPKTVNVSFHCDQPTPTPTAIPTPTPTREVTPTPTNQPTPTTEVTPTPTTPIFVTPTPTLVVNNGCDDVTQVGNINNANCQNQNQNQQQNQYNNNNQSQSNNQNITVSYVYPTPQPVVVQAIPQVTTLPSTGSPFAQTLSLLGMLPTGLLLKKFTKRG